ncbi:hypothetical protein [Aeromicrobium sp. UC242_57]|uniref:hypothetical protein n=1 Tax=Aeromicrobium sp. UC242_57 TaxID=3374624 RepID=UPI0037C04AB7
MPAKSFTAKAPSGYLASGSTISVSATGLAAGEKFTASVAGGTTVTGTATAAGVASAKVKTGGSSATRAVSIKGSRTNRVGTTSVKILAAKKLLDQPQQQGQEEQEADREGFRSGLGRDHQGLRVRQARQDCQGQLQRQVQLHVQRGQEGRQEDRQGRRSIQEPHRFEGFKVS